MNILSNGIFTLVILMTVTSCSDNGGQARPEPAKKPIASAQKIVVGGLYASKNEDGTYGVMKVLAVDDHAVHLRSYKNKFTEIPKELDSSVLSLGGINDPDGFGIGHFPFAKEGFWKSKPVFIKQEPVADDELEGYRMYLDAMKQKADEQDSQN